MITSLYHKRIAELNWKFESPWNISPPSIDLHGVSVKLSVAWRDDSLYLTIQSYARWTYIPGTFIPTTPGPLVIYSAIGFVY